jgi:bifunctional UDP-N-acetylglucosamine pyrophosphorylase/glucosamine-1-phosphate N-acetyltransferase
VEYAEQAQQLGTGHALLITADLLKNFRGDLLVVPGDTPLLSGSVLKSLIRAHQKEKAAATLMTAVLDPTPAYGRIIRDDAGRVLRIVEQRDASPEEKKIKEVNTSHYCFKAETVLPLLSEIGSDNDQQEYYLTDIVEILSRSKKTVVAKSTKHTDVLLGINSRQDLARITKILQTKICDDWMAKGVTLLDPESVTIEPGVRIGPDTVIHPFTTLAGNTKIGSGCVLGPQTILKNAKIGNNTRVEFSTVENASVEKDAVIGPFASIQTFE